MSRMGKIGFLIAALCLVVAVAVRFILGVWIPLLYLLLAVAGVGFLVSLLSDRKLYFEFLSLRTTKHGMNMGVLIVLVVGLVVCLNYVSVRHNKTWDVTTEKLNSLSDSTLKVIKSLDEDAEFKIFYKGADALEERQRIRQALGVFQENSPHVKVRFIDSYADNILAQEYLSTLPDRDQEAAFAFVDYKGKRQRVDSPYGEEQIAKALVKATRKGEKKIYFLTGHSERELQGDEQQGLKAFYDEMLSSSFVVESLSLVDKSEIPPDAALLAVIGPKSPLLENELTVIRNYLKKGGRLFLAADPGERHNLSQIARWMGIDFKNNFIINLDPLTRQASGNSLGVEFDSGNPVTAALPTGKTLTLFDLASELAVDPAKSKDLQISELVKTAPTSFTLNELKAQVAAPKEQKSFPLMMAVKGKLEEGDAEFSAIFVGDSDYLTNRLFLVGSNRDLAMNGLASLTDQADLISVRPKQAKTTKLVLTSGGQVGMILAGISLPVALLLLSGVFWFKRRSA